MEGRGWNDTPQLLNQNPTGKLKINLNKRVAFPLQKSTPPSDSSASTGSLPPPVAAPPPALHLPPAVPSMNESESTATKNENSDGFDPSVELERISRIFHAACVKDISQASVQASVEAKLKNFEDEWASCDIELQKLIAELASYVERKDGKEAGGVQRKIIMQGHNKPWMHGIRQIILNIDSHDEVQQQQQSNEDTAM